MGPPLAIGWTYEEHDPIDVDDYESQRVSKGNLRMSSITRKNLLHNVFGIPEEEIRNAEKEVQRIREQREATKTKSRSIEQVETAVQSAKRKLRRRFSREKLMNAMIGSQKIMFPLNAMMLQ